MRFNPPHTQVPTPLSIDEIVIAGYERNSVRTLQILGYPAPNMIIQPVHAFSQIEADRGSKESVVFP